MASIDGWGDMGYKEILLSAVIFIIVIPLWAFVYATIQINRFGRFMMKK